MTRLFKREDLEQFLLERWSQQQITADRDLPRSALNAVLEQAAAAFTSALRCSHAKAAADLGAKLAAAYSLPAADVYCAGIAHDLCKELVSADQQVLARVCPIPCPPEVLSNHRFTHGPAAAALLFRTGLCTDLRILQAVAWHTVGSPEMDTLALLVFCADKIEPGRGGFSEELRAAWLSGAFPGEAGLLQLAGTILDRITAHCRIEGHPIADTTPVLYNALQQRLQHLTGTAGRPPKALPQ
ncbi:MAG: HD domain-containing protein [Spirochaetes bacterium]|nr:HD domain-containing protein [Spirochaetota bacterium]